MSNPLFRQSSLSTEQNNTIYSTLGFLQNPFPSKPSVVIGSPNPVENGSIYLQELHEDERKRFEELLIPKLNKPNTRPIVFLMDYATSKGRGIGKTSFLFHQAKRIMKDLGDELSEGTQVIFGSYVMPISGGDYTKFWQFTKLITEELVEQNVVAIAVWRLISDLIPNEVLAKISDEPEKTIGNDKWLRDNGVETTFYLPNALRRMLSKLGINDSLISALSHYGASAKEFQKNYLDKISDFDWRKDEGKLLFEDLVKVFKLAGFTKGLILCDAMEKIIQSQNAKERRDFTEALRYYFIDGKCENARLSFYNLLLTIHPYSQELLNPHWSASGLDRFSALSGSQTDDYTVYIHPLNPKSAKPLAVAYLEKARLSPSQKGSIDPFTSDAIEEAIMATSRVPGKFLNLLHLAIEKAIEEKWTKIDKEGMKLVIDARVKSEADKGDQSDVLPHNKISLREEE